MYKFFLNQYIRILEKILNLPVPQRDDEVDLFLRNAWMTPGFRKYSAYRVQKIKDELCGGIGMKERDRDDYIRFTGQRVEALLMADTARKLFESHRKGQQDNKKLST